MSTERKIACDFTAIPEDERDRHKQTAEELFSAIEEVRELSEGYAFRLPAETRRVEQAGKFMARERLCCPFFNFNLEVTNDNGPVWLELTGDEEVQRYIENQVIPKWEE